MKVEEVRSVFSIGFLENFIEVRSIFETFLVNAYVGELESQVCTQPDM